MTLDERARGMLETIIDDAIRGIPEYIRLIRLTKTQLHIKDESEFVYGLAWGKIISDFTTDCLNLYKRDLTAEERTEVSRVIVTRSQEIREAIFKMG